MASWLRLLAILLLVTVPACEQPPTEPTPEPLPEPRPDPEPPPEPPVEPPPEPPVDPPPAPPAVDTVSAMTFNIFHDAANAALGIAPWATRRDLVAGTIGATGADVVGLQEAFMWQVAWLEGQLPSYAHVGRGRNADGSGESTTILYRADRFTLEDSGFFWLSGTPDEAGTTGGSAWGGMTDPRMVSWARLGYVASDRELYVYNTHLPPDEAGGPTARRLSVILLADRIAARSRPEVPFVLLGDFNAREGTFPIQYLKGEVRACNPGDCAEGESFAPVTAVDSWRLLNAGTQGTRCRNNAAGASVIQGERVDYVLVMSATADTATAKRRILSSATRTSASCASDHVGVLSRFVVP
jgi:endonuclease/exonuclease/phosphatase family metal-dependent hydrolase